MSLKGRTIRSWYFAALIAVAAFPRFAVSQSIVPANDTVLHAFQGGVNDGFQPTGGVVFDDKGNLYGATTYGGNGGTNCFGGSCGTVYELSPSGAPDGSWNETVLYNFTGVLNNYDGQSPTSALLIDRSGNLYGLTAYGGNGNCMIGSGGGPIGCGAVYEMSPPAQPGGTWVKTTIYSFQGGNDGFVPFGNLIVDAVGNIYGTTIYGGGFGSCNAPYYLYCGVVFELSPPSTQGGAWVENVLYSFKNGIDGANPYGGLVIDKSGAIYGTTYFGGTIYDDAQLGSECQGAGGIGCGTVFKLQPSMTASGPWQESIIHRFQVTDGSSVNGGLRIDDSGNLYGTTKWGGGPEGVGGVFELSPPGKNDGFWHLNVIFGFSGRTGELPIGPLTTDGHGGFYGTASQQGPYFAGQVFHISHPSPNASNWNYSVICNFPSGNQVAAPEGELTIDKNGAIFGLAAVFDHVGNGAVYRINPSVGPTK